MPFRRFSLLIAVIVLTLGLDVSVRAQNDAPAWSANLADLRRAANLIPGRRPARINVVKFAESRRTKNFSV